MYRQHESPKKFDFGRLVIVAITAVVIITATLIYLTRKEIIKFGELGPTPLAYNSTLSLLPGSGVLNLGEPQRIAIQLTTGGDAINAVQTTVVYDPQKVTITEILTTDSFCQLFPVKTINATIGEATIGCGLPTPGFSEATGTVAVLSLGLNQAGTVSLGLKDSLVLANDGLGTNVLRSTTGAEYQVTDSLQTTTVLAQGSGMLTVAPILSVTSPTHPDPEQWYKSRDVQFVWTATSGYQYVYHFDQLPALVPDSSFIAAVSPLTVTAPADGVFYFHMATKKAGVVQSIYDRPVRVDTAPPQTVNLSASQTEIKVGEIVQLVSSGQDDTSGVQSAFYLREGSGSPLFIGANHSHTFSDPGEHILVLQAFDNAGNYSEDQIVISVTSPGFFAKVWSGLLSLVGLR